MGSKYLLCCHAPCPKEYFWSHLWFLCSWATLLSNPHNCLTSRLETIHIWKPWTWKAQILSAICTFASIVQPAIHKWKYMKKAAELKIRVKDHIPKSRCIYVAYFSSWVSPLVRASLSWFSAAASAADNRVFWHHVVAKDKTASFSPDLDRLSSCALDSLEEFLQHTRCLVQSWERTFH